MTTLDLINIIKVLGTENINLQIGLTHYRQKGIKYFENYFEIKIGKSTLDWIIKKE
jgi:hypothetical protein